MSGYIMDLRQIVGHRTLIQAAASIICVDAQGRLLLGRRTDNRKWGYSGGSAEIDEKIEDCARRELREEMGLEAGALEFFCVNSGPETHYVYPNGDEVSNVEIVYLCRDFRGEARPEEEEMEELAWFAPEQIDLRQISPPIRPVIRAYLARFAPDARRVAACGNDCSACPRFLAEGEEELRALAVLWKEIGYRDTVVDGKELACGGCREGIPCRFGIRECVSARGIADCAACGDYPCPKNEACFRTTESFRTACERACSPAEWAGLRAAFFEKRKNLDALRTARR